MSALTNPFLSKGEPGPVFLHNPQGNTQVKDITLLGDSVPKNEIKLRFLERGRNFIFYYFYPGPVSHHLVSFFDGADAPDIQPLRRIELQGIAASRGFRVTEHDTNFHTYLVNEYDTCF
ncbi:hypothetical protein ES703_118396 [subsurface metagenome]